MGTRIEMVAVSKPLIWFSSASSIKLSVRAAKQCLRESKIHPSEIGLLINTGVYRYRNTGEPAIAALIQKKIGLNLAFGSTSEESYITNKTTFSFDLNNGGCGWLTGIEIIDGFLKSGEINYGMVVTGDSEPFPGLSESYNFEPAASAIMLSGSKDNFGFSLFRSYSYPQHKNDFYSLTNFVRKKGKWGGRNILTVSQKESYIDSCINCAEESLHKFIGEAGISFNEIDLLIPSQTPAGFPAGIMKRTGLFCTFIELSKPGKREFHTAGPGFALKKIWDDNRFKTSKNIIFLTVGSGISVSIALYINKQ
jgi:3-oxoacyl-[acyl-carrier-protein] synthase-3